MTIRQIREADIDSFYATFSIVVRERKFLAFLEPPPIEQTRAFVRRNIEKGYPQLVAMAEDAVVGWCDITPPGREVMAHVGVLGIALHPDWRGQGLGERLMREALAAGDTFGYLRVELGVFARNTRAQALYRKLGFVEEGIKRRQILIDGVFHDQIMMARLKA
ncbi:MAG: N-acetyltransferase family protein [Hyphomicrobiaceae bacterium]